MRLRQNGFDRLRQVGGSAERRNPDVDGGAARARAESPASARPDISETLRATSDKPVRRARAGGSGRRRRAAARRPDRRRSRAAGRAGSRGRRRRAPARSSHTSQATTPPSTGTPSTGSWATPASFSSPLAFVAKRRAISSWSAARTLMQKRPDARTASSVFEPRSRQTSMSSGSSESDVSALVVAPRGPVSSRLVTTATPVAQWAIRRRSCSASRVALTPRWSHNGVLRDSSHGRAELRRRS